MYIDRKSRFASRTILIMNLFRYGQYEYTCNEVGTTRNFASLDEAQEVVVRRIEDSERSVGYDVTDSMDSP
jgi:hypothetical protein